MYNLDAYAQMVADGVRMDAYRKALSRAVTTESVVVDLGAGTGIFALLACQLGASKVYAIEPSDAVFLGAQMARDHGFGDRLEVVKGSSFEVQPSEAADVLVSDLRGAVPLFGRHIPAIVDARSRFLRPGAVLIPRRDLIWAAPVTLPAWHEKHIQRVSDLSLGLDLSSMCAGLVNLTYSLPFGADALLASPSCWTELDYRVVDSPHVESTLSWEISGRGRAHGLGLWFEAELGDGIAFSTAPGGPESVYGRLVLPFARTLDLERGDTLAVDLSARLVGDDYLWRWETGLRPARSDGEEVRLSQSTFYACVLSPRQLKAQADDFVPSLSEDGLLKSRALSLMDGAHTLREIADRVAEDFPRRFPSGEAALDLVRGLARELGR
jgi:protein arginine N-methyltransferase 1